MSQVTRRWIADHAIDNSKIDNTGFFSFGTIDATSLITDSLRVNNDSTFSGASLFTDGSFTGNVKIEGTLSARLDSTIFDQLFIEQDENQPAIIAQQTGGSNTASLVQLMNAGTGKMLDMTGLNLWSNPAIKIRHGGGGNEVYLTTTGSGGGVGTANLSGDFSIYAANAEAIRVKTDGKVSIGNGVDPLELFDVQGNANIIGDATVGNRLNVIGDATVAGSITGTDMSCDCLSVGGIFDGGYNAVMHSIVGSSKGALYLDCNEGDRYGLFIDSSNQGALISAGSGGTSGDSTTFIARNRGGSGAIIQGKNYSSTVFQVNYDGDISADGTVSSADMSCGRLSSGGAPDSNYIATVHSLTGSSKGTLYLDCNSGGDYGLFIDSSNQGALISAGSGGTSGDSTTFIARNRGGSGAIIQGKNNSSTVFQVNYDGDIETTGDISADGTVSSADMSCGRLSSGGAPDSNYIATVHSLTGSSKGTLYLDCNSGGDYGLFIDSSNQGALISAGSGGTSGDSTTFIARNRGGSGAIIQGKNNSSTVFQVNYDGTMNASGDIYSENWTDFRANLFDIGTGAPVVVDCTGWSVFDTASSAAMYKRVGKTLHIKLDITGTSNSPGTVFILPYKLKVIPNSVNNGITKFGVGWNGGSAVGPCRVIFFPTDSSNKIGVFSDGQLAGWAGSGIKSLTIDQSFELD